MNELRITTYATAVTNYLRNHSWLNSFDIDVFPERMGSLIKPAAYLSIKEFERSPSQPDTGQLSVILNCEILLVLGVSTSVREITAVDLSMAVATGVNGQRFGLKGVEPAIVTTGGHEKFEPGLEEYIVWSVSYRQTVRFSNEYFGGEGVRPTDIFFSRAFDGDVPDADEHEKLE